MQRISTRFSRRTFLRGTGVVMAIPFLESMGAGRSDAEVPMRMFCVGNRFGYLPKLFFPTEAGRDYETPELLKPIASFRKDFTVMSQLDHGSEGIGGHGGIHNYLTGVQIENASRYRDGMASVDQMAAQHVKGSTRYTSMHFCCGGNKPHNRMSWRASGTSNPPIEGLASIFSLLFDADTKGQVDVLKRNAARKTSILDLVRTDAARLSKQIGKNDAERLDQYFTSVRELEQRLTQSQAWYGKPKPVVDYRLPNDADNLDFVDRLPLYYDLIALALQTDSTRVVTLGVGDLGSNSGGLAITKGYHQLTHHGKDEDTMRELAIVEKAQTGAFAHFLEKASGIKEANGKSLLDNSMTLFGSGMGNASAHSNKNLPLILAGGGFRHGQHLRFEKDKSRNTHTPAGKLFVSMLQRFGMEADAFKGASGTLTGLEV